MNRRKVVIKWCNDWKWKPPAPRRFPLMEFATWVRVRPFNAEMFFRVKHIALFRVEFFVTDKSHGRNPHLFVRLAGVGFAFMVQNADESEDK